ncbi:MAG: MMPL family transporter [Thermoleophilia bacterium]|nr:MMPL family transporter [Thermoleophilia bacterium]
MNVRAKSTEAPDNLAARIGRWSARHRRKAVLGWLAFVITALAIGGAVGTNMLADEDSGVGESRQADQAIAAAFPDESSEETVLVQSAGQEASQRRLRAAVGATIAAIRDEPGMKAISNPYAPNGAISEDGRSALIEFEIAGDDEVAGERVEGVLAAVREVDQRYGDLRIEQFGFASADNALTKAFADDFRKAETTSLPITLAILVLAFGALVAAGIPLLLAISAVAAALGLIGPISRLMAVDEAITSVVLLIGLAVAVDYAMFYLRREREERAAGRGPEAALAAAAATSGRAVLISGLTVMVAMAGMYFAGAPTFSGFATGTIVVVAVSVLGSLTVLPAVLSKLGDRVERGRVPVIGRLKRSGRESRLWGAVIDRVTRRPLASLVAAGGLLVALAVPAFSMHTALPGVDTFPRSIDVIRTYDRIQADFPGNQLPAVVAVEADDVTSPEVAAAIEAMTRRALASGEFHGPASVRISPDRSVAEVSLPIAGDGTDERSVAALERLREEIIPATVGAAGAQASVTGITASNRDFNDVMKSNVPYVFAFVLTMAFVLLLVSFRSIVIPLKAIALNLLSVAAAYGVLVLVFQHGHLSGLLGVESTGAITSWLPLFLFVVLFGLSMDYHVFILTRVREAVDAGSRTEDAIAHGIKSTAGVVTSAAVVMVAVFSIFGTLSMVEFKQMGVGLAVAVLIDATIVRGVLLPAAMMLLGERNWWLPRRLRWLPRVSRGESAPGSEPTAPVVPAERSASRAGSWPLAAPARRR